MADKLNDLAGRMGKAPKGLGTGIKLLAAAAAGNSSMISLGWYYLRKVSLTNLTCGRSARPPSLS